MTYREAAPRAGRYARRFGGPRFQWYLVVIGIVFCVAGSVFLHGLRFTSIECAGGACVVSRKGVFAASERRSFDDATEAGLDTADATYGRGLQGKRLAIRWNDGSLVEIGRGPATEVDALERSIRTHLVERTGTFSQEDRSSWFIPSIAGFVAVLGLLMSLDGLGVLAWRVVTADPDRHVVAFEVLVLGIRVKRTEHVVSGSTVVGRLSAHSSRNRDLAWLTFETPGSEPRKLPFLDFPHHRDAIEEALARA